MTDAAARCMFPQMPPAIFDMWLQPIIETSGWPFESVQVPVAGSTWEPILLGYSLECLVQLRWHRREMPFAGIRFTPQAQSTIGAMFECHVAGWRPDPLMRVNDTMARFYRCHKFIKAHRRVPAPCALVLDKGAHAILDENHRTGAMAAIDDDYKVCVLDAWVGE